MSNREWLNTLSDEEFAKFYVNIGCGACAYNTEKYCKVLSEEDREPECEKGTALWLKQEHKENTNDGR